MFSSDNLEADLDTKPQPSHTEDVQALSMEDLEAEKRLVRRIDKRLLLPTAIIYLLCYLDRSNVGNARIMNSTTNDTLMDTNGITNHDYTIAMMLFLVAYSIFEAPSNLALKKFQPHRWLGFLVVAFGAFCTGIGFTHSYWELAVLRFFLGAAEAGVFPGMIFYFTFWYKPQERAIRIAVFMCSATLSGAFGGAIAYGVGKLNGSHGFEGWRWLFIIEGLPSIVVGILVFFFLPSYPEQAGWLTEEEKELQIRRLGAYRNAGEDKLNWKDAKETLTSIRLYMHYLTYMTVGTGVASLAYFAPTIVEGLGYSDLRAQLFTVPPYGIAYPITLLLAWLSDRTKSRGYIALCASGAASIAFIIQACLPADAFTARYIFLIVATAGVFGGLPSLNAWVGDNVRNVTASSLTIALNIAFSGPGQIIGVWIYRPQDAPAYRLGHGVNAGMSFVSACLALGLTLHYRRANRKMKGTNEIPWVS
ncbi:major facilitator superfamily domain-containing protein [Aspergillus lucknowensis]|uniref:Major facilitator superfamily domain-containing protein n=1 Tax=Aspergillus lucknowensis TaxID=176173 RepID=A0ABR4LTF0_9EURO